MAAIVSKLGIHEQKLDLGGLGNKVYSWDDPRFIDLKKYSTFFKIKSFHDFSEILPEKYEKYKKEELRILSWMRTLPEEGFHYDPFPKMLASLYLSAQNDLLGSWVSQIRKNLMWEPWEAYYEKRKDSFDLLDKMRFFIKTKNGKEKVDLLFAENFRFKANEGSLNLFHMPKERRDVIIPQDGESFLFMVDFRQFEFRTFLMITDSNVDFEDEDLYEHVGSRLSFSNPKLDVISYLYSQRDEERINKVIDKPNLVNKMGTDGFCWQGMPVFLKSDYAFNKKIHTIIQTISYFIYLKKFSKILKLLKNKKSKLIFPLHDAIIFSISFSEAELVKEIEELLVDDVYKIKKYIGYDLKNMEKV